MAGFSQKRRIHHRGTEDTKVRIPVRSFGVRKTRPRRRARARFGYLRVRCSPFTVRGSPRDSPSPSPKLKLISDSLRPLCLCGEIPSANSLYCQRGWKQTAKSNAQSTYNGNRADLRNQRHRAPSTRADRANPMGPAAKPAQTQTRQTSQPVRRCMCIQLPMIKPRANVSIGYAIRCWPP